MTSSRCPWRAFWPVVFCVLAFCFAFASARAGTVGYFRLGDDDPDVTVLHAAMTTTDSATASQLAAVGTPSYALELGTEAAARVNSRYFILFNGASGFHTAALPTTATNNFCLEAWVRPANTTTTGCVAYNGNSATTGWGIYQFGTTFQAFYGGLAFFGSGTVTPGVWTHLALVRNAGTGTLYVNGVASGSTNSGTPNVPAGKFVIGVKPTLDGEFFNGLIDEVRVFTFASGQFNPATDLLRVAPDVAVAQPAGSALEDGVGSQDFGPVIVGASANLVFTVTNSGLSGLTGLAATMTGADAAQFSVTSAPATTLAVGGTTTFTVRFTPAGTGAKAASLRLASNDPDENPFDIALTGAGQIVATPPSTLPAGASEPVSNLQPTLVLQQVMTLSGSPAVSPALAAGVAGSSPGEIRFFAGQQELGGGNPAAAGQTYAEAENSPLFGVLGRTYGGSAATSDFAVPDLCGRLGVGLGTGAGLSAVSLGQVAGTETVTLAVANLPAHTHTLPGGGTTVSAGLDQPFDNRQPSLGLRYLINGDGELRLYAGAGTETPEGFVPANGQFLSIANNPDLFALLGTSYGGNGQTTFALPDLRGRVALGVGIGGALGERFGTETVTLTTAQLPSHAHGLAGGGTSGATGGGAVFYNTQPSLSVVYAIAVTGYFPSYGSGDNQFAQGMPLVGEVRAFATNTLPAGFLPADGRQLPIGAYPALYATIGTRYGGDGPGNFALPDLRGRAIAGIGAGAGLTERGTGDVFGAERHLLTTAEMAAHTHNANLAGLTLNAGSLSPAFAPDTTSYSVSVSSGTTSLTFTPTVETVGSALTINGTPIAAGAESAAFLIDRGDNVFVFTVSIGGVPIKSYTVTVTRTSPPQIVIEQPAGATLAPLATVDFGTLVGGAASVTKTFTVKNTGFSTLVVSGLSSSGGNAADFGANALGMNMILPSLAGPTTFYVTFTPGAPGARQTTLRVESNDPDHPVFDLLLTATVVPSSNANLAGLTTTAGALVPAFASGTLSYAFTVPYATTALKLSPWTEHPYATITSNGAPLVSGSQFNVPLAIGANAVPFVVTAQDGVTTRTYTVTITRLDTPRLVVEQTPGVALTSIALLAWGYNGNGQTTIPAEATGVVAIAGGGLHSLARRADGRLLAWGDNTYGQCTVPAAALSGARAFSAGYQHSVAIKADGGVIGWGESTLGQTTIPANVQSGASTLSSGLDHSLALMSGGFVRAWGWTSNGAVSVPVAAESHIAAVAAGGEHDLALDDYGAVLGWGGNDYGQIDIPPAARSGVTAIAAGFLHSLALKNDGSVLAWGEGGTGATEVPAAAASGVVAIAAAGHSLALKSDGSVIAWGWTAAGQQVNVPAAAQSGVFAIAAGGSHNLALRDLNPVNFGARSPGPAGIVRTFTLKNTGPGPLTITGVGVTGGAEADFVVDASLVPSSLPGPAGQATFTVTFRPGAQGLRKAFLHVDSNDPTLPVFAVTLEGTGLPPPFTVWAADTFGADAGNPAIAGATADPDGDGVANLLEFAVRSDPVHAGPVPSLVAESITLGGGVPARRFSFPYSPAASDLRYVLQYSTNLATWTDVCRLDQSTGAVTAAIGVSGNPDGASQTMTVTITDLSYFTASRYFWRLTVEQAP